MYQSIDEEPAREDDGRTTAWLRWPVVLAVLAAALVFAVVYATSPGQPAERGEPLQAEPGARAAYLQAISEPDTALRRARLRDFVNQNPEDTHAPAAQAQLYVLDRAEGQAWQDTVAAAYAPGASPEERRAAVSAFQNRWGRYLGGREAEVEALLAEIEGLPETAEEPDRALPRGPSPFPDSVPTDQLAGGPVVRPPVVITRPAPNPAPPPSRVAEVTPPRVRRDVTPRYPRRAQRRGISGVVTLALNIDSDGRVAMTEVLDVQAERYADDFVRAAERAAMRTRFHPKTVDGEPTEAVGVRKRYRFQSRR